MVEKIPQAEIDAARVKLKRRLASMLVRVMAESGSSFDDIDTRAGFKTGFSRRYLHRLIDGKGNELNMLSDLCLAMDVEVEFHPQRLPEPPHPESPND